MPSEEQHAALKAAYTSASNAMNEMNAAASVPVDVSDHSIISRSMMSPFAVIFELISGAGPLPYTHFSLQNEEWSSWLLINAIPALVVLGCGLIVCIWLLVKLLCHPSKKATATASTHHIRWSACVGFAILWVCVGLCVGRGTYAYDLIYGSVVDLQPDLNFIVEHIGSLQPKFHNAAIWMEQWQTSCIGWDALEPSLGETIREVNKNYTTKIAAVAGTLYDLDRSIYDLPMVAEKSKELLDWFTRTFKVVIGLIVFAPTVLATIVIGIILDTIFFGCGSPRCANTCMFKLGAVPLVSVVLICTIVASVFCFAGTSLGNFCGSPEENTVNLVSSFREGNRRNNITTLVSYYVEGHPPNNTIVETLRTIEGVVHPLAGYMWIIAPALDILGLWCSRVGSADLVNLLQEAIPSIKGILPVAKRDHVYGHYDNIVNRGICGQLVGCFGFYMLCQIVAGMVLLPIIAVESHNWLLKCSEEDAVATKKQEEAEALIFKTQEEEKVRLEANKRNVWGCCRRSPVAPLEGA